MQINSREVDYSASLCCDSGSLWVTHCNCYESKVTSAKLQATIATFLASWGWVSVCEKTDYCWSIPLKALFGILCVCLHLCDRGTLGSCSSLRRIALTMFPLWSDSMWAGVGPSPRPQALWFFTQSHGPFLCVSSLSDMGVPRAAAAAVEVQGETNTLNPTKDAASALHTLTCCMSSIHC